MASNTVVFTGTLLNPAGSAKTSAKVEAVRLQDKATAAALTAAGVGSSDKFTATSHASTGVFSITITHQEAHLAPLAYKLILPDNRYAIIPVRVGEGNSVMDLGNITVYDTVFPAGSINITNLVLRNLQTPLGVLGAKNGATVTAKEFGAGNFRTTILTLTATPITLSLNGTSSAGGGVKIYDFPEGQVLPLSATSNLTCANAGGDGSFLASLGSVSAGTDGTLTSTEANFTPSTAATISAGVGTCKMKSTSSSPTPGSPIDGAATAVDLYLNSCLNADGTGKTAMTFTGTITLNWLFGGDN